MTTIYEWCYETVEDGDIIDHHHEDNLSNFNPSDITGSLCLVRSTGDGIHGLSDRYWAYVTDGVLEEYFRDGMNEYVNIKVPTRFHKELSKYNK